MMNEKMTSFKRRGWYLAAMVLWIGGSYGSVLAQQVKYFDLPPEQIAPPDGEIVQELPGRVIVSTKEKRGSTVVVVVREYETYQCEFGHTHVRLPPKYTKEKKFRLKPKQRVL